MAWDDTFADDAVAILLEMGEDAIYTPKGGTPRTIKVMADRSPRATEFSQPKVVVVAGNRATSSSDDGIGGILASAINFGGDTLRLAERLGGASVTYSIFRFADSAESQDAGMVRLELI